jgi:hypothetical protein
MAIIKGNGSVAVGFMAEFQPLTSLWAGENPPYPSKYSAQWAVRKLRPDLAQANAMASHRGRLMIHPQRFAEVAERAAIAEFAARCHG